MNIVLTGATGYLGKHLLAHLLCAGHTVHCLTRSGTKSARQRVALALAAVNRDASLDNPLDNLFVVDANVAEDGCALTERDARQLRSSRVDAFVHCAGLTRFESHLADELLTQNLFGTRHAYRLASALGVPRFHQVSTAYVAGDSPQPFEAQDLARGQAFRNPYERSKFEAEQWLHAQGRGAQPKVVVHRPSIVVGGNPCGERNEVSTIYTFMKAVHFLRRCCERDRARGRGAFAQLGATFVAATLNIPLRVAAAATGTLNLVDIADVVEGIAASLAADDVHGTTHMLVGYEYSLDAVADAITAAFDVTGVQLVPTAAFEAAPRNPLEQQFWRMTKVYAPYLFHAPCFVQAHGRPPRKVAIGSLASDFRARLAGEGASVGNLALGANAIQHPRDYFNALAEKLIGRHFLKQHSYVTAEIDFTLTGAQACAVRVCIAHGAARLATSDAREPATCRYQLDSDLFMKIIEGATDLRAAFLAGRVKISGDLETALKFGALLGYYYQHLERHVVAELTA